MQLEAKCLDQRRYESRLLREERWVASCAQLCFSQCAQGGSHVA